jgi:hypothetical protein
MRLLCVSALIIACCSCGDERLRSARGDTADRERASETFGARLAELVASPDRVVPLRDVVSSRSIVGRRVRVVGRCASPLSVPEPPARSTEAWQFEADGITVLVVGARPGACSAPKSSLLTLSVVVAEDTLTAIGDLPAAPRRYLVLLETK